MSQQNPIPTNPQLRRQGIARLLALAIIRMKRRPYQRNVSANAPLPLDINVDLWVDSTTQSTSPVNTGDKPT